MVVNDQNTLYRLLDSTQFENQIISPIKLNDTAATSM